MNEEEIRLQIMRVVGEYLSTGNTTRARRQLNMLKINTLKSQAMGKNFNNAVKKIEIAKKLL